MRNKFPSNIHRHSKNIYEFPGYFFSGVSPRISVEIPECIASGISSRFFFFKDPSRNILAMVVSGISTEFLQEIFNSLMQCFEDSSNNSSRPLLWVHKDTGLKTPSWDPNGIHLKIPPITPLVLFQKFHIMLVPTENFLWDSSEFLSGVYQEFLWGFRAFKWFQSKTCF